MCRYGTLKHDSIHMIYVLLTQKALYRLLKPTAPGTDVKGFLVVKTVCQTVHICWQNQMQIDMLMFSLRDGVLALLGKGNGNMQRLCCADQIAAERVEFALVTVHDVTGQRAVDVFVFLREDAVVNGVDKRII